MRLVVLHHVFSRNSYLGGDAMILYPKQIDLERSIVNARCEMRDIAELLDGDDCHVGREEINDLELLEVELARVLARVRRKEAA